MTVVELQLDKETLDRALQVAARRRSTLEALIAEIIGLLAGDLESGDPLIGMFSQEPDLMDQVIDSAMNARETDPLRVSNG